MIPFWWPRTSSTFLRRSGRSSPFPQTACWSIRRNRARSFRGCSGWIEAAGRSVPWARRVTWPIRAFRPTERGSPWTSRIISRETWTSGSTNLRRRRDALHVGSGARRRANLVARRAANRFHVSAPRPSGHLSEELERGRREEPVLASDRTKYVTDWSPDGRFILYRAVDATTNLELWALPVGGGGKPIPFLKASFGVSQGQFSPDGRWVAYASNESGKWEIAVAPFPGPGGNWKVSTAGGTEPRWRRDGKELYYLAPDGKLMAVDVKTGPTFEAGVATAAVPGPPPRARVRHRHVQLRRVRRRPALPGQ